MNSEYLCSGTSASMLMKLLSISRETFCSSFLLLDEAFIAGTITSTESQAIYNNNNNQIKHSKQNRLGNLDTFVKKVQKYEKKRLKG